MKMVPKLTLEDARIIMAEAEKKAREIGVDALLDSLRQ